MDGKTRAFPTRADLVESLIANGEVESEADLLENHHDKISDLFFAWVAYGQTGCLFAARLARRVDEAGWLSIVVPGANPDDAMVEDVNAALQEAGESFHAVQFIFPHVDTAEGVARLVACLSKHERWSTKKIDCPPDDRVTVGLRWTVPGDRFATWVLGFAPLDSMPFTRQAPFTAIVLRVREPEAGVKSKKRRPGEDGVPSVHLADVPALMDAERFERTWNETERQKALLLTEEETSFAKAKTTFTLPASVESLLP